MKLSALLAAAALAFGVWAWHVVVVHIVLAKGRRN